MEAKKILEQLHESKEFKEWLKKANNKKCYLSHIFYIVGSKKEECQIGYYDGKKDEITSFEVGTSVRISSVEKPFKPEDMKVKEVDMKEVVLDFKEAIAIVEDLQKTKYPAERPIEIIAVLQNLEGFGIVFNITHVTQSFKTLNVKVNAENGDILKDQLVSVISFPQKDGKLPQNQEDTPE
jgi:hypothetical protein